MSEKIRVSLIHATPLAVDPIVSAFKQHWPEVENVSLLDEALSIDRGKDKELTAELHERIVSLARYAESLSPAGILFTCSAFGGAIEAVAESASIPVLKPNEAMFEQAFSIGERVAMVYTFPPAIDGMVQEFREEGSRRQSAATIQTVFAEGARVAIERGDTEAHNQIITDTVAAINDVDVILLAHFSMARAANAAQAKTSVPVLNSPESAVNKIKAIIKGV